MSVIHNDDVSQLSPCSVGWGLLLPPTVSEQSQCVLSQQLSPEEHFYTLRICRDNRRESSFGGETHSLSLTLVLLLLLRRTLCVVMHTSSVVARWMSAAAWTSRSTTSVWSLWLAPYTGLQPFCKQRVTFCVTKRFGLSTSYS